MAVSGFRSSARQYQAHEANETLDQELNLAVVDILKAGRLATACTKTAASELTCVVSLPGEAGAETRFRIVNQQLVREKRPPAGAWVIQKTYDRISGFVLCADADMQAGTCTLLPAKINTQHSSNLTTGISTSRTLAGRFFRFSISAATTKQNNSTMRALQSSFWVRNPTEIGGATYLVGVTE